MNIEWKAKEYTDNFSFVHNYGENVLELLDLPAGSKVIDLGCGNGALTQKLQDKGYAVVGMDASADMLAVARRKHPDLSFIQADATRDIPSAPVDGIFSNAVFHWINAQHELFTNVSKTLKPGGQLVFEMGGAECAATVHNALRQCFMKRGLPYAYSFYFPTVGEYAPIVEAHDLRITYATWFKRPTEQKTGEQGLADWIKMFVREAFKIVDEQQAKEIMEEAAEICRPTLYREGKWYIDYTRLRMKAVKK